MTFYGRKLNLPLCPAEVAQSLVSVPVVNRQTSDGVADEILAKRDEDRGRKRDRDGEDLISRHASSPKRARSVSSYSTDSVSTISTNRSASASLDGNKRHEDGSGRRHSSKSPSPGQSRKRRYSDSADSYSGSSYSSGGRRPSRSGEWAEDRNIRRRRRESSPYERGRHRDSKGHSRRGQRSSSVDKSQVAKERRSMTPHANHDHSGRRSYRTRDAPPVQPHPVRSRQDPRVRQDPPRERSLSPYSKRLALTQAMNMDR